MNLYLCLNDVIATFHSLSVFSAAISGYSKIVLIMFGYIFFFNKKIACSLSVSVFVASALNSIMKSVMFFFPCLKVFIFHLASAVLVLSLNIILISHMNSS